MDVERQYMKVARDAANELKDTIDKKIEAIYRRDYDEVYRLAGVISLLAAKQERVDRLMHIHRGSGEDR